MAKNDKPKTVTLVAPDGTETEVSNPTAVNNLIYAGGYRTKAGVTPEEAAAAVTPDGPATGDAPTTTAAKK